MASTQAAPSLGGQATSPATEGVWIFGYGSLTWKTNFKHGDMFVGCIHGYERLFYQGSTDHRGVPGAPGRVVTLVENEAGTVFGMAYYIAPEDVAEVFQYLDYREKGGYVARQVRVSPIQAGAHGPVSDMDTAGRGRRVPLMRQGRR